MVTKTKIRRVRHEPRPGPGAHKRLPSQRTTGGGVHWLWLAGGLALSFAVPFVFADLLAIHRDVYYAIYAASVLTFLALWSFLTRQDVTRMLARQWPWAVGLGVVFAGVTALIVFQDPSTSHPDGWAFTGAVLWRGIVYGVIDGLLLSSFPILATFAAFGARPLRERTKRAVVGIGALALAISIAFTVAYHVGYSDFRGSKMRKPVAGDLIWSVPTLATLNPVGAPIAHVGLHVAAVTHSYETETFLPPHR